MNEMDLIKQLVARVERADAAYKAARAKRGIPDGVDGIAIGEDSELKKTFDELNEALAALDNLGQPRE